MILKFAELFYKLASSSDIVSWVNDNLPSLIRKYVVESKDLKQCGTLSQKIVDKALEDGLEAELVDSAGHVVVYLYDDENVYVVDATHLQFQFPYHGSLRDFGKDERDSLEYLRMKNLFEELSIDPMKAVKIEIASLKSEALFKAAKSGYVPADKEKWAEALRKAKSKFDVYPSAYANLWASKEYKRMGGSWKKKLTKKADLREWLKEKWVRIDKTVDGKHPPCGREDADKGDYPKCRPQAAANSMTDSEKRSASIRKERAEKKPRKGKRPHYVSTKAK